MHKDVKSDILFRMRTAQDIEDQYRSVKCAQKRAHAMVCTAVREGILIRPTKCSTCGMEDKDVGMILGHHETYDKPLDVVWLCRGCHALLHLRRSWKYSSWKRFSFKLSKRQLKWIENL